jgi:uncharacterized protein YbjQ (UPF0145 family)
MRMANCAECEEKLGFFDYTPYIYIASKEYRFCGEDCRIAFASKNDPDFMAKVKGKAEEAEEYKRKAQEDKRKNLALQGMLFVSDNVISGSRIIKTLGTARGATVRAKHVGRDIAAGLKNIVGGELKGYTELLAEGREEAIQRMKEDAYALGANAVVMTRFSTSMIEPGAVEVMAYGTAVVSELLEEDDV